MFGGIADMGAWSEFVASICVHIDQGTIKEKFTQATPQLYAKFNYRVKWFDGWENHKLVLDDYLSGLAAPYKAWVLLERADGMVEQE